MQVRFIATLLLSGMAAFGQEAQSQSSSATTKGQTSTAKEVKPEDRCTVEGTIASLKDGHPLGKADIEMRSRANRGQILYAATSDSTGHYVVEDIDPGSYTLTANRNGYVGTTYGSDGKKQNAALVTLTAAQHMTKVDVKLPPQAVVSGAVLDESGEPMVYANVHLLSLRYENGKRSARPSGPAATTNDKGEYRIFGIAAGKYWLRANARNDRMMGPAEVRSGKQGQTTYAEIYFPAGLSIAEGTPIRLAAGDDLTGIDFRMSKVRSFTISGTLLNAGGPRNQLIQLTSYDASGSSSWDSLKMATTDSDGRFAFRGCQPGRYKMTARSTSQENRAAAQTDVSITDGDVNVSLEMRQNPDLQGLVRSDDPNQSVKQGMTVFLSPEGEGPVFSSPSITRDDGTFTLKSVSPERFRVSLHPIPDGDYIKSIQLRNIQAEDTALDLTNGSSGDLVITLGTRAATISGTVQDDQQRITTQAKIVLIPDDRKLESRYQTATPDQNGHFIIKGISPGAYKLFAFDHAETGSWLDPEWLKQYESKGESVEVKESDNATKTLVVMLTGEP